MTAKTKDFKTLITELRDRRIDLRSEIISPMTGTYWKTQKRSLVKKITAAIKILKLRRWKRAKQKN